jgi:hypothetical protein
MEQQSIIVNFNPNFANGSASDFTQPFNKQLQIEPNSEVALYQGNLQRKTIVVPQSEQIEIDFTEQLPSSQARVEASAGGNFTRISALRDKQENLKFTIPKGNYTQSELIEEVRTKMSNVIIQQRRDYYNDGAPIGLEVNNDLLYEAIGQNDEDGVFIGLAPLNRLNALNYISTANVGTEVVQSGSETNPLNRITKPTSTSDTWNQFITPGFPLNPLSAIQNSSIIKQEDQQNVFFYDVEFERKIETNQRMYVGFLNNAMTSNLWASPTIPVVKGASPDFLVTTEGLPTAFFGIHHQFETDSSNNSVFTTSIYVNRELDIQSSITDEFNEFKTEYSKTKLSDPDNHGFDFMNNGSTRVYKYQSVSNEDISTGDSKTFGVRVYSVSEKVGDNTSTETQESRKYFFQVLGKDQDGETGFYSGVDNVIFDSKNFNISLPQDVVEDACFTRNFLSYRDGVELQDLGLEPYIFFRNCELGTMVFNPRGTYIKSSFDVDSNPMINTPIVRYQLNYPKDSVLKLVLGGGKSYSSILNKAKKNEVGTSYDPNLYPQHRGPSAGVNALYSDNQRYNFEILSLPIRTFNSTKTVKNVSGNERSILHSTETFIEGEVTELTNALINKNIIPSTLKYISLKNSAPLRLNDIEVRVTRADTNEIADEITDCSFEMLVRHPK